MVKISSKEAAYLRSQKLGGLIHISSPTHKSRAKRYYMTEDPRGMKCLEKFRKSNVVYSYGKEPRKRRS